MEKHSDPRNVAIARRLWAAISEFNSRAEHGEKFKIDSNVGRILAHDPDYVAQSPRAQASRKTDHPSVLHLMEAARRLKIPVSELLGEEPAPLLAADRARLEQIARDLVERADWIRERFGEKPGARTRDKAESPRKGISYPIGITGEEPTGP